MEKAGGGGRERVPLSGGPANTGAWGWGWGGPRGDALPKPCPSPSERGMRQGWEKNWEPKNVGPEEEKAEKGGTAAPLPCAAHTGRPPTLRLALAGLVNYIKREGTRRHQLIWRNCNES